MTGTGVKPSLESLVLTRDRLNFQSHSWVQSTGAAFQFAETYQGPGLIEKVIIDRETIIESVIDSTSTFSQ